MEMTISLWHEAMNTFDAMRAAFIADLNRVRKGRKTARSFEGITSSNKLTAPILEIVKEDPRAAYIALAANVREMTEEEVDAVEGSTEVAGQGILPCGEPAQTELFYQSPIRVTSDDFDAKQRDAEVNRFVRSMRAVSQMEKSVLFIRYQANDLVRKLRNEQYPRRARFGGRLYASDRSTHDGILLAIIEPNEKGGTLGTVTWDAQAQETSADEALALTV